MLKSLEYLADRVPYESLPADWNTFDLARFSPGKALWDYQQKALERALAALWKYYEEFDDYIPGQDAGADKVRKEKLTQWYEDAMLLSGRERRPWTSRWPGRSSRCGRWWPTTSRSTKLSRSLIFGKLQPHGLSGWPRAAARRSCW